jgi:hypothetical protein
MGVFDGMIVKMKVYDKNDKILVTQELKDYSDADLDPGLFLVPDGFKEVSAADFEQAEQGKMMKSMMGAGGGLPGMDANTAAAIADAEKKAADAQKKAEDGNQ